MRQVCLRGGALPSWVTNVTSNNFILWPNLDLVPKAVASFEASKEEVSNKQPVQTAEKNYLRESVVLLYEYNRTQEAGRWFDYLKANFTNALLSDESNLNVEGFAFKQVQAEVLDMDQIKATAFILGLTTQEYLCRIADDDDRADTSRRFADAVWRTYQNNLPGKPTDPNYIRMSLAPMAQLRAGQLEDMEHRLSPQAMAILRNKLGLGPKAPPAPPPNGSPPTGGGSAKGLGLPVAVLNLNP